jgi:hypothetical protein
MTTLELYTDYVSNPKSPKWDSGEYPITVQYSYVSPTKSSLTFIKVKSLAYAQELIEFWNACKDGGTYTLIKGA